MTRLAWQKSTDCAFMKDFGGHQFIKIACFKKTFAVSRHKFNLSHSPIEKVCKIKLISTIT